MISSICSRCAKKRPAMRATCLRWRLKSASNEVSSPAAAAATSASSVGSVAGYTRIDPCFCNRIPTRRNRGTNPDTSGFALQLSLLPTKAIASGERETKAHQQQAGIDDRPHVRQRGHDHPERHAEQQNRRFGFQLRQKFALEPTTRCCRDYDPAK